MKRTFSLVAACSMALFASANVSLPALFSDGMVLQQNDSVNVWGWAKPYEEVTVKVSWDTTTYKVVPTPNATFSLKIKTPAGSDKKHSIEFGGYNKVTVNDVLIGEVILCSGQSNMEFSPSWGYMEKTDSVVAQATQEDIRMFRVDYRTTPTPSHDVSGCWRSTTPENVMTFSAIGYFIACKVRAELGVPVGIIDSSWGGTPVETWTPAEPYRSCEWLAAQNKRLSPITWGATEPGVTYNAMIAPLAPYSIRAVAWYQGEQNCENADAYAAMLKVMVGEWRKAFKNEKLPFVYAQIAPYKYDSPGMAIVVRDQQRLALDSIPNSALVVIGDLGDLADIHPHNKVDAGARFANAVLSEVYGKTGFLYKAPLFKSASLDGKGKIVVVEFANNEGLRTRDGKKPDWFEVAGDDGVFHPAKAVIRKGKVYVSSSEVRAPAQVRFAWSDVAMPNLTNSSGVQASCFGAVKLR